MSRFDQLPGILRDSRATSVIDDAVLRQSPRRLWQLSNKWSQKKNDLCLSSARRWRPCSSLFFRRVLIPSLGYSHLQCAVVRQPQGLSCAESIVGQFLVQGGVKSCQRMEACPVSNLEKIIRLKTVLARTGLSRSTLYRKINEGSGLWRFRWPRSSPCSA